jgi:F-type H+-transporting ATPase subunit epsilon
MAQGKTIDLEIMTPLKKMYSGQAESIIGTATDGLFGVLYNHAPMLAALGFGTLTLRETGGGEKVFVTSDGFFEITNNRAAVLVDTAETGATIDLARAEAAKKRAEERLERRADKDIDAVRAEAALHRAIVRIKAARIGR